MNQNTAGVEKWANNVRPYAICAAGNALKNKLRIKFIADIRKNRRVQAECEKAWYESVDCSEFGLPLDEKYVSSTDCYRKITAAETDELEKIFVPLIAEPDAPVYASQDGTVIFSEFLPLSARGQMIVIEHDNGLLTLYWGVSQLEANQVVSAGDRVTKGQQIGTVGHLPTGAYGIGVGALTAEEAEEKLAQFAN